MTSEVALKVLCGQCGAKIGEVLRESGGLAFRPILSAQARRDDRTSIARFVCTEHGYTDESSVIRRAEAVPSGKTETLRAHTSKMRCADCGAWLHNLGGHRC